MSPSVNVSTQTTGVEFTEQYPLLVIVGKVGNDWTIQVSNKDKFPPDGKLYSVKMDERINAIPGGRSQLKTTWQHHGVVNAPPAPHFIQDSSHHPIVVRPGEYVRFICDYPFVVWAHRDQNVAPNMDSPENPFGWTMSQQSTQQAPYVVIAVAQSNIAGQRFYKCQAWITVNGQIILVDPDTVGTTDGGG
jgi:hypothetical protein